MMSAILNSRRSTASTSSESLRLPPNAEESELPFISEDGVLVNSGEFNGLTCAEAQTRAAGSRSQHRAFGEAKVTYRLKDWGVSRQRYWGTPIPMIHCPNDGLVAVPDDQLPVHPAAADRDHAAGRFAA